MSWKKLSFLIFLPQSCLPTSITHFRPPCEPALRQPQFPFISCAGAYGGGPSWPPVPLNTQRFNLTAMTLPVFKPPDRLCRIIYQPRHSAGCWLRSRWSQFVASWMLWLCTPWLLPCQNGDLQGPRVGAEEFLSGARDRPVHHWRSTIINCSIFWYQQFCWYHSFVMSKNNIKKDAMIPKKTW